MAQPDEYDYLSAPADRHGAMANAWMATDEIIDGLFLGPMESRQNVESMNIAYVISVVADVDRGHPDYRKDLPAWEKKIVLDDDKDAELPPEKMLEAAITIHAMRTTGQRVLVHCMAGRSRSTTVVIAYLVAARLAANTDEALALVVKKRSVARPNKGFMQKLRAMEHLLQGML